MTYARAAAKFERIATIGEAQTMLGWDAAAMMPPGGGVPVATSSPCLRVSHTRN